MSFFFHILMIACFLCFSNAFTPIDNYLIDCGSSTNTTIKNRVFLADLSISSSLSTPQSILANTSSNSVSSFESSALYKTARIFTSLSSYSFPIRETGRHFIRLHFFPFLYQSYNLSAAKFAVSAQNFLLMSNFDSNSIFKEYSLYLTSDTLTVSFMPLGDSSIAFVSAIEVVSVPNELIANPPRTLNPFGAYTDISEQALETVYRINMGAVKVSPDQDTLSRNWDSDQPFLLNKNLANFTNFTKTINYVIRGLDSNIAPDIVYGTATKLAASNTTDAIFNLTWEFNVDTGPQYLIRMHFCDIVSKTLNLLYFNVYINGLLAIQDLDLSSITNNTLAAPYYVDFIITDGPDKISVSIGPSMIESGLHDAILNGVEIMKMNIASRASRRSKRNLGVLLGSIFGAIAVVIIVAVAFIFVRRRRRKVEEKHSSLGHSNLELQYSFILLQDATKNFDDKLVIGVGGFGKVYKGVLKDGTEVAVKRGNPKSQQGLREFRTEIELLSGLRHRHLVSLIGYCDENNEMILVYEYMEKGTLRCHLYGSDSPTLTWKQRLEVCIGSAKGLHYLHTGSTQAIIHRDVKSANILLDESLLAKVADFGLSKTGPELDQTHVSTAVKGSFGYLDPEYFRRQQLTEKSDVYSFGVVLMEVICARPVIDPALPREMVNLAEWGMKMMRKGEFDKIIDPLLAGEIKSDSLRKFTEITMKCLEEYGVDRPTMGDVLWNLEYALKLQEDSMNSIAGFSAHIPNVGIDENVTLEGLTITSSNNSEVSMDKIFSHLINSEGR